MILSASRRTDIPALYSNWFMERIKAGYVMTRNPMNKSQVQRIPLSPDTIDCIVFWTKDPFNMLDKLSLLDEMGYRYYFQFMLTPYDKSIEQNLCSKADIEDTFMTLSRQIGSERVIWRYDPILLNNEMNIDFHKMQFERLCKKLHSHTDTVIISFIDLYRKLKTNLIREITFAEMTELSAFIGETAKSYGLSPVACCEAFEFASNGIDQAHYIDEKRIEKICGQLLDLKADKNQRLNCSCAQSVDIGPYNTCVNGCLYCYANQSIANSVRNHAQHHVENEFLL